MAHFYPRFRGTNRASVEASTSSSLRLKNTQHASDSQSSSVSNSAGLHQPVARSSSFVLTTSSRTSGVLPLNVYQVDRASPSPLRIHVRPENPATVSAEPQFGGVPQEPKEKATPELESIAVQAELLTLQEHCGTFWEALVSAGDDRLLHWSSVHLERAIQWAEYLEQAFRDVSSAGLQDPVAQKLVELERRLGPAGAWPGHVLVSDNLPGFVARRGDEVNTISASANVPKIDLTTFQNARRVLLRTLSGSPFLPGSLWGPVVRCYAGLTSAHPEAPVRWSASLLEDLGGHADFQGTPCDYSVLVNSITHIQYARFGGDVASVCPGCVSVRLCRSSVSKERRDTESAPKQRLRNGLSDFVVRTQGRLLRQTLFHRIAELDQRPGPSQQAYAAASEASAKFIRQFPDTPDISGALKPLHSCIDIHSLIAKCTQDSDPVEILVWCFLTRSANERCLQWPTSEQFWWARRDIALTEPAHHIRCGACPPCRYSRSVDDIAVAFLLNAVASRQDVFSTTVLSYVALKQILILSTPVCQAYCAWLGRWLLEAMEHMTRDHLLPKTTTESARVPLCHVPMADRSCFAAATSRIECPTGGINECCLCVAIRVALEGHCMPTRDTTVSLEARIADLLTLRPRVLPPAPPDDATVDCLTAASAPSAILIRELHAVFSAARVRMPDHFAFVETTKSILFQSMILREKNLIG